MKVITISPTNPRGSFSWSMSAVVMRMYTKKRTKLTAGHLTSWLEFAPAIMLFVTYLLLFLSISCKLKEGSDPAILMHYATDCFIQYVI